MRVAITGASGYIGKHVAALLKKQGAGVRAISRTDEPGVFRCMATGATGSLRNLIDGADHVVHLAGRLVDDPSARVTEYVEANVALTEDTLQASVDSRVASFVHASSRLVYPRTLTAPAVEDLDAAPDTAYGLSKRWAEDLVQYYSSAHDMPSVSLRIGQVTGGDHPGLGVINSFLRQARDQSCITVHGDGVALREFVHVEDVAGACVAALAYRGPWMPVNIGGTEAISVREIAQAVARLSPHDVELRHKAVAAEDTSCYALSHDRARRTLHWEPRWSPDDMIQSAYEVRSAAT